MADDVKVRGVLAELQMEIARRFGDLVRSRLEGPTLVLVCQGNGATIGVTVDDPIRPTFGMTYPAFDADAVSWKELREYSARGVLLVAVLGILRVVEKDGAVLPEFSRPSLRRRTRRAPPAR
jgi:hypothetical protein